MPYKQEEEEEGHNTKPAKDTFSKWLKRDSFLWQLQRDDSYHYITLLLSAFADQLRSAELFLLLNAAAPSFLSHLVHLLHASQSYPSTNAPMPPI